MILTGKAKEDFFEYVFFKYNISYENSERGEFVWYGDFNLLKESKALLNATIVEWFDSVGYTIDRDVYGRNMTITDWTDGKESQTTIDCDYLEPFLEWWEEAIIKANEIYNEKKSTPTNIY